MVYIPRRLTTRYVSAGVRRNSCFVR